MRRNGRMGWEGEEGKEGREVLRRREALLVVRVFEVPDFTHVFMFLMCLVCMY